MLVAGAGSHFKSGALWGERGKSRPARQRSHVDQFAELLQIDIAAGDDADDATATHIDLVVQQSGDGRRSSRVDFCRRITSDEGR